LVKSLLGSLVREPVSSDVAVDMIVSSGTIIEDVSNCYEIDVCKRILSRLCHLRRVLLLTENTLNLPLSNRLLAVYLIDRGKKLPAVPGGLSNKQSGGHGRSLPGLVPAKGVLIHES
jgi:hypothetical protein